MSVSRFLVVVGDSAAVSYLLTWALGLSPAAAFSTGVFCGVAGMTLSINWVFKS